MPVTLLLAAFRWRQSVCLLVRVQFKMVSMRWEKPMCAPFCLPEVFPILPSKHFQYSSNCQWPPLVLSRKIVERFLFPRLSPPGDPKCDLLGFVPVASQAPQHFRSSEMQTTCGGSFARQSTCSVISLSLWHVKGSTSTDVCDAGCRTSTG